MLVWRYKDSDDKFVSELENKEHMIELQIKGITLFFETDPNLFSPRKADEGTLGMLEHVDFLSSNRLCV